MPSRSWKLPTSSRKSLCCRGPLWKTSKKSQREGKRGSPSLRAPWLVANRQTLTRRRAFASTCEAFCETRGFVQGRECKCEVDETRERSAAEEGEGLDSLKVATNMEAGGSHLQATAEEERIVDWTQDLREIRRLEFLVRRERGTRREDGCGSQGAREAGEGTPLRPASWTPSRTRPKS